MGSMKAEFRWPNSTEETSKRDEEKLSRVVVSVVLFASVGSSRLHGNAQTWTPELELAQRLREPRDDAKGCVTCQAHAQSRVAAGGDKCGDERRVE